MKTTFQDTPEQTAIHETVKTSKQNLIIGALAGTGKTTQLVRIAINLASEGKTVLMICFGAKARDEMSERVDKQCPGNIRHLITVKNFHGNGFSALRNLAKYWKLDENAKKRAVLEAIQAPTYLEYFAWMLCKLARESAYRVNKSINPADIIDQHDLVQYILKSVDEDTLDQYGLDHLVSEGVRYAEKALNECLRLAESKARLIDFADQLWIPLIKRLEFPPYDVILSDETQDNNAVKDETLARMIDQAKARGQHTRLIMVGDNNQAIFMFAGAMSGAMAKMKARYDAIELPLTVNYRCSQAVIEFANQFLPEGVTLQAAPGAIKGSADKQLSDKRDPETGNTSLWFHGIELSAKDAMVCRNMAPLVKQAYALYAANIPCHVEGRDLGKGLTNLILKLVGKKAYEGRKYMSAQDLADKLVEYESKMAKEFPGEDNGDKLQSILDKTETIKVFIRNNPKDSIAELVAKIESLFQDRAQTFTLLTGPRSKGREFTNVYWLDRTRYQPSKWAVKPEAKTQELNLLYVMATRAKVDLIHVTTLE